MDYNYILLFGFIIVLICGILKKILTDTTKQNFINDLKDLEKKLNVNIILLIDYYWGSIGCTGDHVIDMDDDERFMERIVKINSDVKKKDLPLYLIIYAHGGTIASSDKIVEVLLNYKPDVHVYVPCFAFSAGTMVTLCADKIYMNELSLLSPVDPQITYNIHDKGEDNTSSRCFLQLMNDKTTDDKIEISDDLYLKALESEFLHDDNINNLHRILNEKYDLPKNKKKSIVKAFGSGNLPHHKPFSVNHIKNMGINVITPVPDDINNLFLEFIKIKNKYLIN